MGWYILKRLLQAIPLLLGIITVTFFIVRLAPGDPMDIYLEAEGQGQIDPQVIELLRQKYGLDQPIHIQYVKWVANVARGDLGESFRYRRPVSQLLAEAIPYTLQLTILAVLLDALIGIALGIISAVKQYSVLDKTVTLGSLTHLRHTRVLAGVDARARVFRQPRLFSHLPDAVDGLRVPLLLGQGAGPTLAPGPAGLCPGRRFSCQHGALHA